MRQIERHARSDGSHRERNGCSERGNPVTAFSRGGKEWRIPLPPQCGVNLHRAKRWRARSEEHTSELQSLMRISYAVFCLKKKKYKQRIRITLTQTENNNK